MEGKTRTLRQNNSLHKYFEMLSDELNGAGLDVKKTLEHSVSIPWTPTSIKEILYRPIMLAMTGKESTTELETKDLGLIYDTINRYLSEQFGLHVEFPSEDSLINKSLLNK